MSSKFVGSLKQKEHGSSFLRRSSLVNSLLDKYSPSKVS
jgi:hypothetical protein